MTQAHERFLRAVANKDTTAIQELVEGLGLAYSDAYRIAYISESAEDKPWYPALTTAFMNQDIRQCTQCPLHENRTQAVPSEGNIQADLMFIGEAPGQTEDAMGRPFVGKAGELLNKMITAAGWARESIYIANIVKCRPPDNRDPHITEVGKCLSYLQREIEIVKPKVIVCLGSPAARTIIEPDFKISANRGKWYESYGAKCMAIYHPAFLLRRSDKALNLEAWQDLQKVMKALEDA